MNGAEMMGEDREGARRQEEESVLKIKENKT